MDAGKEKGKKGGFTEEQVKKKTKQKNGNKKDKILMIKIN